jgi:MFS family permease
MTEDKKDNQSVKQDKQKYDLNFLRERARAQRNEAESRIKEIKEELKGDFESKRKASRKISIIEGSFNSVTDGAGSRYISPFALALGANNSQIGLLTAIPNLVGNFSQILSSWAMERISRKKLMVWSTLIQSCFWLLVILAGILFFIFKSGSSFSVTFLIVIYTMLISLGSFYAPIWASWMKDLVDPDKSGKYFGTRNKVTGFIALISMLIGGFILDKFAGTKVFIGFFILFGVCFFARLISSQLLRKKYEPHLKINKEHYFSFLQFIKKMAGNNFGRFVIITAVMQLVINFATPFFAVYMLKGLSFSYVNYTIVVVSSIIGNLVFVPLWGKFADKYGNAKTMKITSYLTCLVPLGWFASFFLFKNVTFATTGLVAYLAFVEFLSGVIFGGFNLSLSNFVYDAVTREKMALCTAYSNIIQGIGTFIGATLGGVFASTFTFGLASVFIVIFLISGVLRILISTIFMRKINEVRMTDDFTFVDISDKFKDLTPKRLWEHLDVTNFKAE